MANQTATPRQRYAAGQTLRAVLDGLQPSTSEQDYRVRTAVLSAARALERGRNPLEAMRATYGGNKPLAGS